MKFKSRLLDGEVVLVSSIAIVVIAISHVMLAVLASRVVIEDCGFRAGDLKHNVSRFSNSNSEQATPTSSQE